TDHTSYDLHLLFFLIIPPPPRSTLFPYTTLFRSLDARADGGQSRSRARPRPGNRPPQELHPRVPALHPHRQRLRLRRLRQSARRSEEHTSELQSLTNLVCRLLLEKKKNTDNTPLS